MCCCLSKHICNEPSWKWSMQGLSQCSDKGNCSQRWWYHLLHSNTCSWFFICYAWQTFLHLIFVLLNKKIPYVSRPTEMVLILQNLPVLRCKLFLTSKSYFCSCQKLPAPPTYSSHHHLQIQQVLAASHLSSIDQLQTSPSYLHSGVLSFLKKFERVAQDWPSGLNWKQWQVIVVWIPSILGFLITSQTVACQWVGLCLLLSSPH